MKTSVKKAKGRRLQQWVVAQVLRLFPSLTPDDVRSTPMGAHGVDVQLSTAAKELFPYDIECKNWEAFKNVYKAMEQAEYNSTLTPVVVIKSNHKTPLVVMRWEDFEYLMKAIA